MEAAMRKTFIHMSSKTGYPVMNRKTYGYAARLTATALTTALLALAGCTGTAEQAKKEEPTDLVWPLPPDPPRIKYVRSYRFREDVEERKKLSATDLLLGKKEEPGESLKRPYGVHADRDGRIFVTDTGWGKVVVFDSKNRKFEFWGESGRGTLQQPIGVTSDSTGRVYVTDAAQRRVVVFDRNGEFALAMGQTEELERPTGIAIDEDRRRVYVVDTRKHNIVVFDLDGRRISTIGERGTAPGQFNFPTNLAVGRDGRLYVMDSMNFRVQILDPDGRAIRAFGENGRSPGQFARAKGIALDSEGHIYVVDAAFNNFQIFDPEGQLLLFVGSNGKSPGQFWLPAGAYIDNEDRVYVADQYNLRVQVFQYLGEPAADAPAPQSATAETPAEQPSQ